MRTRAYWLLGWGRGVLGWPPKLLRGCLFEAVTSRLLASGTPGQHPVGAQSHPHPPLTCLLLGRITGEPCSATNHHQVQTSRGTAWPGPGLRGSESLLAQASALAAPCPHPSALLCREGGVGRASASQRGPEAQRRQACLGEEPQIAARPRSPRAEGAPQSPAPASSCELSLGQPQAPSQEPAGSSPEPRAQATQSPLRPGSSLVRSLLQPHPWLGRLSPGRRGQWAENAQGGGGGPPGPLHAPAPMNAAGCWPVSTDQTGRLCQGRVGLGARVVRGLLPARGWGGGGCKRALLIPAAFQGRGGQLGAHTHPQGSRACRSWDAPRSLNTRPFGATGAST